MYLDLQPLTGERWVCVLACPVLLALWAFSHSYQWTKWNPAVSMKHISAEFQSRGLSQDIFLSSEQTWCVTERVVSLPWFMNETSCFSPMPSPYPCHLFPWQQCFLVALWLSEQHKHGMCLYQWQSRAAQTCSCSASPLYLQPPDRLSEIHFSAYCQWRLE